MEWWNIGFRKDFSHFNFIVNPAGGGNINANLALSSTSRRSEPMIALKLHFVPNIPTFHNFNWGEVPNLIGPFSSLDGDNGAGRV